MASYNPLTDVAPAFVRLTDSFRSWLEGKAALETAGSEAQLGHTQDGLQASCSLNWPDIPFSWSYPWAICLLNILINSAASLASNFTWCQEVPVLSWNLSQGQVGIHPKARAPAQSQRTLWISLLLSQFLQTLILWPKRWSYICVSYLSQATDKYN